MNTKKTARYGLLIALAFIFSYIESVIMVPVPVPGIKLGLANLTAVFALYRLSLRDAASISLTRVLLVSLTFGNAYSLAYSLAGGALSLAVMALLKKTGKFSIVGVSVAGGVGHNVGQILVAMGVLGTARLAWYLPALLASGTAAGVVIGIAGGLAVERVRL